MCEEVLYKAVGCQIDRKNNLSQYLKAAIKGEAVTGMLSREDECELDQWIHGEGLQYGHIPAFTRLMELHGNLQKCTSAVLKKTDSGEQHIASRLFRSEYAPLSKRITHTLVRLNAILNGHNNKLFD